MGKRWQRWMDQLGGTASTRQASYLDTGDGVWGRVREAQREVETLRGIDRLIAKQDTTNELLRDIRDEMRKMSGGFEIELPTMPHFDHPHRGEQHEVRRPYSTVPPPPSA